MQKEYIDKYQLFALIIIFQIGSTTLFALGIDAKQDAWMVILIALGAGLGLTWLYTEIQKHFPHQNLMEILVSVLGKWIAIPFIILYAIFFFYISTFILYEFAQFMIINFFQETPIQAILLITISLVMYCLFLGIEAKARSSQIVFPYLMFFILSIYFLSLISGIGKIEQLSPTLENGIMPIMKATPSVITFPFGEMIVFLMYWCYVNNKQEIRRISLLAVGISGILLTISLGFMIAVLGVHGAATAQFPLFKIIQKINIGDFIQRLDAIGGAILFIGGFYKMTLYFNASRLAVETLINKKNQKWLMVLMGVLWYWFILVYFPTFSFYREVAINVINPYLMLPYQFILPFLLLMIIKLKIKLQQKQGRNIHVRS
ncbi:GerAB/ArcD/ProY family transporter [Ammoniphilus sp. YIM 78166]|uniref:GerAB/ArcD/ProY family transporter n=1 Tax=Ammoniphilus sp. YIM 78166 TaxID=1644106 RepID=UPI0010700155|nr:GerAB/ArcD/ProY family transporter [Ammoniphilus sp. YIM 78166]